MKYSKKRLLLKFSVICTVSHILNVTVARLLFFHFDSISVLLAIIMPGSRRHMDVETATRAVFMLQEGESQRSEARRLGVSRRAIRNAWERFLESGSCHKAIWIRKSASYNRPGRPVYQIDCTSRAYDFRPRLTKSTAAIDWHTNW